MCDWNNNGQIDPAVQLNAMKRRKLLRGIAAVVLPAAAVAAAVYLFVRFRPALRCPFYALTGLYCPGCGTCRALEDIFNGRFAEAFSHNMLLFILGIPALIVFIHEYVRVFIFTRLRPVYLSRPVWLMCVLLVFSFWVLRNLTAFSVLAP